MQDDAISSVTKYRINTRLVFYREAHVEDKGKAYFHFLLRALRVLRGNLNNSASTSIEIITRSVESQNQDENVISHMIEKFSKDKTD